MSDNLKLECKTTLKNIVQARPEGADCNQISRDYKLIKHKELPWRELGFKNITTFLASIPDVLRPLRDLNNCLYYVPSIQVFRSDLHSLAELQKNEKNLPAEKKKTKAKAKPKEKVSSKKEQPAKIIETKPVVVSSSNVKPKGTETVEPTPRPIVYLSKKVSFSSAHCLNSANLDVATNRALFGKCNNPLGHGHNYKLKVTVFGPIDPNSGILMNLTTLKDILNEIVGEMDHKFIDKEVPHFSELKVVSSVENIAVYIFNRLKVKLGDNPSLYSVKLRETDANSAEYFGHTV